VESALETLNTQPVHAFARDGNTLFVDVPSCCALLVIWGMLSIWLSGCVLVVALLTGNPLMQQAWLMLGACVLYGAC
jgi:hypothetical protein